MRGIELVIGGLLVTSGIVGWSEDPTAALSDPSIEGEAVFPEWHFTGAAELMTTDAALQTTGSVRAWLTGNFSLSMYEYTGYSVGTEQMPLPVLGNTTAGNQFAPYSQTDRVEYRNASVQIESDPDGLMNLWSPGGSESTNFSLSMQSSENTSVFATPYAGPFKNRGGHSSHMIEAPLFAFRHNDHEMHGFLPVDVGFDRLNVSGPLQLLSYGTSEITVEHDGDKDVYQTWLRSGTYAAAGSVWTSNGDEGRYAAIRVLDGNLSMGFEGVKAFFATQEASWGINGTVGFEAEESSFRYANQSHSISNGHIEMVGDFVMDTHPLGEDGTAQQVGLLSTPSLPQSQPTVSARYDGDASAMRANGEEMVVSAVHQEHAKTISDASKIVGLLLVMVGIGRRLVVFLFAASIKDPLTHPRRQVIYEYLQRAGLAHLRDLERATQIPVASLVHHIEILRGARLVRCVRSGNRRVFFVPGKQWSGSQMRRLAILVHPYKRKIAETVAHQESMSQANLAARLGCSQQSVSRHLRDLVERSLVVRKGTRDSHYSATPLLASWLGGLDKGDPENSGSATKRKPV